MATTPEDTPETVEAKSNARRRPATATQTMDSDTSLTVQDEDAGEAQAPMGILDSASATARKAASRGKDRAAGSIDELAGLIEDIAKAVDYRLGDQYGGYARRAASAVSGVSGNLRDKEVDELLEDARAFVRKQPAIALGAAAAIGFALTRLVKAGDDYDDDRRGDRRN